MLAESRDQPSSSALAQAIRWARREHNRLSHWGLGLVAASILSWVVFVAGCSLLEGPPPLTPPVLDAKGVPVPHGPARAQRVAEILDEHIGQPFPSFEITHPKTGASLDWRTLHKRDERLLLLWAGNGGCGYTESNLKYYQDMKWKIPDADHILVLLTPRTNLGKLAPVLQGDVEVYFAPYLLPDWLAPLSSAQPWQFVVAGQDSQLVDWFMNHDSALAKYLPEVLDRRKDAPYRRSRLALPRDPGDGTQREVR